MSEKEFDIKKCILCHGNGKLLVHPGDIIPCGFCDGLGYKLNLKSEPQKMNLLLEEKIKKYNIPLLMEVKEEIDINYDEINCTISEFKQRLDKFLTDSNVEDGTISSFVDHTGYYQDDCTVVAKITLSARCKKPKEQLVMEVEAAELKEKEKEEQLKEKELKAEAKERELYESLKKKFEPSTTDTNAINYIINGK